MGFIRGDDDLSLHDKSTDMFNSLRFQLNLFQKPRKFHTHARIHTHMRERGEMEGDRER